MNYFDAVIKIQSIFSSWKIWFFLVKNRLIFLSALAALISVKKPQNVYRMICANILCRKLSKKLFLLHLNRLKLSKSNDFMPKLVHLLLNAQNGSISIRMHQNVSRMNCANVLYTKLSKKWLLLHLDRLKLKKYLYHFDMTEVSEKFMGN